MHFALGPRGLTDFQISITGMRTPPLLSSFSLPGDTYHTSVESDTLLASAFLSSRFLWGYYHILPSAGSSLGYPGVIRELNQVSPWEACTNRPALAGIDHRLGSYRPLKLAPVLAFACWYLQSYQFHNSSELDSFFSPQTPQTSRISGPKRSPRLNKPRNLLG